MGNAETADAWEHAAELEKELAQVKAELSTERECRVAAEGYIAAIPAMCTGDFSQPCALHVRAPIESLRAQLAAANEALEAERAKFRRETLRTTELSDLLGAWIRCHEAEHGPGPWSKSCKACALIGKSQALLSRPINYLTPAANQATAQAGGQADGGAGKG